jgi:glycosyltransferase involved in cell wall biosynthesis
MLDATIIIPTYNRKQSLLETLHSLAAQSHPPDRYEVVVVDDGSTDGTEAMLTAATFPYPLRYMGQRNQGSAVARNTGAQHAQGRLLIFLDDDMLAEPAYVAALVAEHQSYPRTVGMGTELPYLPPHATPFARIIAGEVAHSGTGSESTWVQFTHCITNNLSVEKADFFEIGMMQDVAGDGPTWWGDVDFGYRAHQLGFRFRRSGLAQCVHRDYSLHDLTTVCKRYYRAAGLVLLLFRKFPEIQPHLPMFDDKLPVTWQRDSVRLIVRKVARRLAASAWVLPVLERLASMVEQHVATPALLTPLYRWIIGGYIFRGYQAGLRQDGVSMGR